MISDILYDYISCWLSNFLIDKPSTLFNPSLWTQIWTLLSNITTTNLVNRVWWIQNLRFYHDLKYRPSECFTWSWFKLCWRSISQWFSIQARKASLFDLSSIRGNPTEERDERRETKKREWAREKDFDWSYRDGRFRH